MKRRSLLKKVGLVAGTTALGPLPFSQTANPRKKQAANPRKKVLRVAHLTDIHMAQSNNAPERFKTCLDSVLSHEVDFILNGGDTIMAADHKDTTRISVTDQWNIWKSLRSDFSSYEMFSCLGNHDMWWDAPEKADPMYGKDYAVRQLEMPDRYYSFKKKDWHFIILDSNNTYDGKPGSLDEAQREWLKKQLQALPMNAPVLIMSHFPILGVGSSLFASNHSDSEYITNLFYQHQDKKIHCFSGHIHLHDTAVYNGVHYYTTGAVSGFWWGDGNESSAKRYWHRQTPPGYAVADLYSDGTVENSYHTY